MSKPLSHVWLVTTVPASVLSTQRVLAEDYMVETLLPDQVINAAAPFPAIILLHFKHHDAYEYQLLISLRRLAARSQIFVIGEQARNEQIIKAYDQGADAYLLLPLNTEELKRKIRPPRKWYQRLFSRQWTWWHRGRSAVRAITNTAQAPIVQPVRQTDINVRFFGKFSVEDKAKVAIQLKSSRIQAVFACLLYHGHAGISRHHLMRNFWPEVREDSARNSLNVAISQLRANLKDYFGEQEVITLEHGHYAIAEQFEISSDLSRFQACIQFGKAEWSGAKKQENGYLLKAVQLYQGDFLADFNFQEWTTAIRDRLWEHYLYALGRLVARYLQVEAFQKAVRYAKLLLREDASHELTHRQLMYAYYRLGKRSSALQQYHSCRETIFKELNVRPSEETEELYQIIVKQERRKVSFPLV